MQDSSFNRALTLIRDLANTRDETGDWPAEEWAALRAADAPRWILPAPLGDGLSSLDLHLRYEAVAAASLAVALVLTQRDGAMQTIEFSEAFEPRASLLEDAAVDRFFSTVGIAQLTTSRQGGPPALRATARRDGWRIDGVIPWCTAADHADAIVAGAALNDGRQLLFLLRRNAPGVTIDPPLPLVALTASRTSAVRCERVQVDPADVLRGPIERVLAGGVQSPRRKGVPIGQAYLALGLCRSAVDLIAAHPSDAARRAHEPFETELKSLRSRVIALADPANESATATTSAPLRGDVNDFAIRVTHAAVALHKGSGLLAGHPAQRLAREAMFLLVWSCPSPVTECTVDRLIDCE